MEDWVLDEFGGIDCGDFRLYQRCVKVAMSMNSNPDNSIYSSQKELAEVNAAYRLFANDKLSEEKIFLSHQEWLAKELKIRKPSPLGVVLFTKK